jgi:hypothetical protein
LAPPLPPKTVAILQSNYLPWKGYFQILDEADVFVFYDDVQYTKNDWRNRNIVKTANGPAWITVPVLRAGRGGQLIVEAQIDTRVPWARSHRRTIEQSYARAPHVGAALGLLDEIYDRPWERLSELNQFSLRRICEAIGIRTEFLSSTEFPQIDDPTGRLVEICRRLEATEYLTGPTAAGYLDVRQFEAVGIDCRFMKYDHPEYPQVHPPFDHRVSIVDLIAHQGFDCRRWIRSIPTAVEDVVD